MTASQDSCRDQYQCSCDELDALVAACLAAGALGSRLTGAGWGGCTVSLVRDEDLDAFLASVTARPLLHADLLPLSLNADSCLLRLLTPTIKITRRLQAT